MAIFKCKMCGGALEINNNESVAVCEYCGTQQTLPRIDDEKKLALFNRANNLRLKSEFDKAAGIYESIIAEFPEEAEAYWGLVLCKYGIEYVDDKDGSKIPTCHRTLPTSIMKDEDFQQACENADISAKALYRDEAKVIDGIQKKILEIASTEEPYDIFICYKETDDVTGARTEDSSIAQDIYTALTELGYKVFYARNTLRKVAGKEYEPYIYAALSSAKIMLAIGTKYDYYDAVWVKNEWSRFISMMANKTEKTLIPCFKNMDAYDIPEEFSNMQALDMADMMFFSSLEASVRKALPLKSASNNSTSAVVNNGANATIDSLLKRVFMFLADEEWKSAQEYCEKILDVEPENARAYLAKTLTTLHLKKFEDLATTEKEFIDNKDYKKAVLFADDSLKKELEQYLAQWRDNKYDSAVNLMDSAKSADEYKSAAKLFDAVANYKDAQEQSSVCIKEAERISNLNAEQQKLLYALKDNKQDLVKLNDEYKELEEKHNTAVAKLGFASQAVAAKKKLLILIAVYFVSLCISFCSAPLAESGGGVAIFAVSSIVWIVFQIIALVHCYKIHVNIFFDSKGYTIGRILLALFIPFLLFRFAFYDYKNLNEDCKDYNSLKTSVDNYQKSLEECRAGIEETEEIIGQLTKKSNEIAN